MSPYREDVKTVDKEVGFTLWKLFKWGIPIIIVLLLLGWLVQSSGIISMDIEREKIQHSQQYSETKVVLLNKLHSDYLTLDAEIAELRTVDGNEDIIVAKKAQQKAGIRRLRNEADLISSSQVPDHIKAFLAGHPRR